MLSDVLMESMVIKRRIGVAGKDGASALVLRAWIGWGGVMAACLRAGYHMGARGEALGAHTCSKGHLY